MTAIYTVREMVGGKGLAPEHYEVSKFVDDAQPEDVYDVTFGPNVGQIYCNCLGFRRQNYPKPLHKHIRLVRLWIQRGKTPGETFAIEPDGEPVYHKNILEGTTEDPRAFDPSN
jgi:hypothetical protein